MKPSRALLIVLAFLPAIGMLVLCRCPSNQFRKA